MGQSISALIEMLSANFVLDPVVVSLTLYKGIDHVQHVKTRLVYTLYEDGMIFSFSLRHYSNVHEFSSKGLMYYLFFFGESAPYCFAVWLISRLFTVITLANIVLYFAGPVSRSVCYDQQTRNLLITGVRQPELFNTLAL